MRLVEMDVAVDEGRQEEGAGEIDALARRIGASRRMQRRDAAAGDFNVRKSPVGKMGVGEDHRTRFRRRAAAY